MASNEHSWNEERNELLREKEALAERFLSTEQKLKSTEEELRTTANQLQARGETILQLQETLEKKGKEISGLQERLCLQTGEKVEAWKEPSELLEDNVVHLKDQQESELKINGDSENESALEKKAHISAGKGTLYLVDHEGGEDDLDAESYPGGRSEEVDRDTKAKAFVWCQQFLSGTWKTIPEAHFQITVVSGGLSNLLYMCSLSDHVQCASDEPRRVLLRIYGAIRNNRVGSRSLAVEAAGGEDCSLVTFDSLLENVMFAILAERSLGPKLYGTFPQGRLEQHIPNTLVRTEQFSDPSISAEIATQMARFHTMVMPFNKEPKWLFESLDTYLDKVMKLKFEREAQVKKFKKLLKFDLPTELERLRELLAATPSPVVFCHNDMNSGNILCLDGQDDSASTERLRLIDFEYSSYNYRGFDFGNHFCEWMYDYTYNEWPFYKATPENYPTREQQLHFIQSYLAEQGGYPDNTTQEDQTRIQEEMLIEANRYALASHFFWGLWSIIQARISKIEFGYLNYALSRFYSYVKLKKLFT